MSVIINPGGSVAIGATISGGTAGRVLFVGTGPVLDDSANFTFDGTKVTIGNSTSTGLSLGAGAVGTPSITFGDADTGLWSVIAGAVSLSADGSEKFRVQSTDSYFFSSNLHVLGTIGFQSSSEDAALSRISAGVIGVGTGAAGSFAGTLQLTGIELGHATDTTLSRSAAGVLAVEGVVIPSISSTNTLTNKRMTRRVGTITFNATPTYNTDSYDQIEITATGNITSMTTNISGTPVNGDTLLACFAGDSGGPYTLAWGTSFADGDAALPTSIPASATLMVSLRYTTLASLNKWVCTGSVSNIA